MNGRLEGATMTGTVQPHNARPATVWSTGGKDYQQISRGIADSIEHCVLRLDPRPGERILDLATGTGWTSRLVARRGANVIGVDIASGLLDAARVQAEAFQRDFIAFHAGFSTDLGICVPRDYWLTVGRRR